MENIRIINPKRIAFLKFFQQPAIMPINIMKAKLYDKNFISLVIREYKKIFINPTNFETGCALCKKESFMIYIKRMSYLFYHENALNWEFGIVKDEFPI